MTLALTLAFTLLPLPGSPVAGSQEKLTPTAHAALPDDPTDLWLVPSASDRVSRGYAQYEPLAEAAERYAAGDYREALQLASRPALAKTPLAGYAAYYAAMSRLRLLETEPAQKALEELSRKASGALVVTASLAAGEAAETALDHAAAAAIYGRLAADKQAVNDEILARLGRAALAAGRP